MNATTYVVEDDDAFRDALCMLLRSVDIPVEACPDGRTYLARLRPGVRGCLLLDIRMPGMSGFEVLDAMREEGCAMPVIFVSAHGNIRQAVQAMRAGAFDFIEKPFADQDLIDLVHRAIRFDQERAVRSGQIDRDRALFESLSQRERDVFSQIVDGRQNKEIADALGVSIRTIESHRSRVMDKLKVQGVADLVRMAVRLDSIS